MVQTLIRLPFLGATTVTQTVGGGYSHSGSQYYSYDFDLDFGQEILAVARGRVVAMSEVVVDGGSASYAGDPSLGPSSIGNFVTLEHEINGRTFYSSYFHLRQGSVPLSVGAVVEEGAVLGQVGNTGARSGTHLHFQVACSLVQWQAGLIADAAATTANATLAADLRFEGYDTISVLAAGSSVAAGAAGDIAANTGTGAVLALNSPGTGSIALARDMDWFRIEVQDGQSYVLTVDAAEGSGLDAYLRLYDADGALLAVDDDSGAGQNARLSFVANQTTDLFLSAAGDGSSLGAYTVRFTPKGVLRTGTDGADTLDGGLGADTLRGGSGNDRLSGHEAADRLFAGRGADALFGGTGADRLEGGLGRDTLAGGAGADIFVFRQGDGLDSLRDFQNGTDRIALSGVAGFAALAFSAGEGGLWLDYGAGSVFLHDVTLSQMDAGDFQFS
ncbi:peptidoglycan DD-metalloendopeptidase family protein [Tabrizicola oligotrophica]|uniref:Peptidoglycan DD-metalloendopeptidase family protein n=1 Tax=Tabrizicola oligotrophica TaxID=2710650 RepID=A0A6M0QNG9_9RHOB|nr:peptidoglycan DD-metalloendopeptidase family protein [Tabrizicola oligotrophica]NEY89000.1 peptidoglycan DD-metalloendopeptidase family protein [Tabrizicola oligotrophica]